MNLKALERPPEWHRLKFLSLKNTPIRCYLVFESDEEGEEYNRYFPFNREGLNQARKLACSLPGGDNARIITTTTKLGYVLPYRIEKDMQSPEFVEWCKRWGVTFPIS